MSWHKTPKSLASKRVIYGHKDGLALTFDVFEPDIEPNGSAVVFIVSGGWFSKWSPPAQTRTLLSPFLAAGYTGFAVRHGSSPRYSIAEAVADVRRAIRTIRHDAKQYSIDSNRRDWSERRWPFNADACNDRRRWQPNAIGIGSDVVWLYCLASYFKRSSRTGALL